MATDDRKLEEALDLRRFVELGMVDRLIAAATPSQISQLNEVLDAWHEEAKRGRFPPEQDQAFHRMLSREVRNPLVGDVLDIFWQVRNNARLQGRAAEPADPLRTYSIHRAIATALAERDLDELRKAIDRHYDDARAGLHPVRDRVDRRASTRTRGHRRATRK
jgi:DNA-binding FadR family transcriptional regulator